MDALLKKAGRILRALKVARLLLLLLLIGEVVVLFVSATGSLHWGWGVLAVIVGIPTATALLVVHRILRSRLRAWVESLGDARGRTAHRTVEGRSQAPDQGAGSGRGTDVVDAEWRER